ncbi:ImmA/IrrE family metallo-endopeptidase [Candidatus Parcubacteria bacterium]|jgi:Zn-dependent peptidase ImmA (M78 family)|nr:MAG: ImmA/IrrE family metallo-endopeptidase [Candidatus Parcubacteria bacterium]
MGRTPIVSPAKAAQEIIHKLNIKNPSEIRVDLIAEMRGATVVESTLTSSEGRLVRRGEKGTITVPYNEVNIGRKRFSIGHELGHFELHAHLANFIACSKEDMADFSGYIKREQEANLFSAELLMPTSLFEPRIIRKKPNMKLISAVADEFNTSKTATACRYMQVTREPCALIYCVDGKIRWSSKSDFPFFLKKKVPFSMKTLLLLTLLKVKAIIQQVRLFLEPLGCIHIALNSRTWSFLNQLYSWNSITLR